MSPSMEALEGQFGYVLLSAAVPKDTKAVQVLGAGKSFRRFSIDRTCIKPRREGPKGERLWEMETRVVVLGPDVKYDASRLGEYALTLPGTAHPWGASVVAVKFVHGEVAYFDESSLTNKWRRVHSWHLGVSSRRNSNSPNWSQRLSLNDHQEVEPNAPAALWTSKCQVNAYYALDHPRRLRLDLKPKRKHPPNPRQKQAPPVAGVEVGKKVIPPHRMYVELPNAQSLWGPRTEGGRIARVGGRLARVEEVAEPTPDIPPSPKPRADNLLDQEAGLANAQAESHHPDGSRSGSPPASLTPQPAPPSPLGSPGPAATPPGSPVATRHNSPDVSPDSAPVRPPLNPHQRFDQTLQEADRRRQMANDTARPPGLVRDSQGHIVPIDIRQGLEDQRADESDDDDSDNFSDIPVENFKKARREFLEQRRMDKEDEEEYFKEAVPSSDDENPRKHKKKKKTQARGNRRGAGTSKGKGKAKAKAQLDDDDDDDTNTGGDDDEGGGGHTRGPLPTECKDAVKDAREAYEATLKYIAATFNRPLRTIMHLAGGVVGLPRDKSLWNVYQQWYRREGPVDIKDVDGDWSTFVRSEFEKKVIIVEHLVGYSPTIDHDELDYDMGDSDGDDRDSDEYLSTPFRCSRD
ncbi:hypothetical protein B0H12DRAFT_1246594 [Mycena haematopus]|nr:hypothetical protein B0H12DRAFT_1246594 [Mycena haematopus]